MGKTKKLRFGGWQEKIHGFLKPEEDKPEHFAAIGRLTVASNGIETILSWILRAQLGTDGKITRAMVGGMKAPDIMAAIKRIEIAKGASKARIKKIEALWKDIRDFRNVRNDPAHKVMAVNEDWMSLSNFHTAKSEQAAETKFYRIKDINALARYAPYLSERALLLFPGISTPSPRLPSRKRPLLLTATGQTQAKNLPPHQ